MELWDYSFSSYSKYYALACSIEYPSFRITIAFLNPGLIPECRPTFLILLGKLMILISFTLTLKIFSTFLQISALLVSLPTINTYWLLTARRDAFSLM